MVMLVCIALQMNSNEQESFEFSHATNASLDDNWIDYQVSSRPSSFGDHDTFEERHAFIEKSHQIHLQDALSYLESAFNDIT
ncbi:unnamed protein product [Protopolystoma xenopodis]|uniref:Uncharacterized protein n=1 Tax=Protopolystoma xenopodis TaxID=117903 RepID=A0A3S5BBP1_9PLAT|nr:unnamed protein product [Protopolystoma xenopodis]